MKKVYCFVDCTVSFLGGKEEIGLASEKCTRSIFPFFFRSGGEETDFHFLEVSLPAKSTNISHEKTKFISPI